MSRNNKPSVRPKRWTQTSTTSSPRPQTSSKDAALARQLMEEDLQNVCSNDEQLAKELQNQLDEIHDVEVATRIDNSEKRRPLRENFNNFPRRNRNPFLRTGLRPLSARFHELDELQQVDADESDDDLLDAVRVSERVNRRGSENGENSENVTDTSSMVVYDSTDTNRGQLRHNGWLFQRHRSPNRNTVNTNQRSSLNSFSRHRQPHSSSTSNIPSHGSDRTNTAPRRAQFPLGLRHRSIRPVASSEVSLSAGSEDDVTGAAGNDEAVARRSSPSDSDSRLENPSASSQISVELEPEELLLNMAMGEGEFLNILRDPMMLISMLLSRAPSLMVPDDIDLNDYDALWDLAERNGEVKNKGLSEEDINKLPLKIHRFKNKMKHPVDCRICLYEYDYGDKIRELPCNHTFHKDCVDEWFKRNGSCPICREEIKPT